jgi:hypothetical protein
MVVNGSTLRPASLFCEAVICVRRPRWRLRPLTDDDVDKMLRDARMSAMRKLHRSAQG